VLQQQLPSSTSNGDTDDTRLTDLTNGSHLLCWQTFWAFLFMPIWLLPITSCGPSKSKLCPPEGQEKLAPDSAGLHLVFAVGFRFWGLCAIGVPGPSRLADPGKQISASRCFGVDRPGFFHCVCDTTDPGVFLSKPKCFGIGSARFFWRGPRAVYGKRARMSASVVSQFGVALPGHCAEGGATRSKTFWTGNDHESAANGNQVHSTLPPPARHRRAKWHSQECRSLPRRSVKPSFGGNSGWRLPPTFNPSLSFSQNP